MHRIVLPLFALIAAVSLAACVTPGAEEKPAPASAAENLKYANSFLQENATAPGVVTLPSGLEYRVLKSGAAGGASPGASDQVSVAYEGRLLNGQVFDATPDGQPATFVVGQLIPAWTEALQKMKPGDQWMLFAPPKLAYGEKGAGPIPPNSALVFKVELIAILPHGGGGG